MGRYSGAVLGSRARLGFSGADASTPLLGETRTRGRGRGWGLDALTCVLGVTVGVALALDGGETTWKMSVGRWIPTTTTAARPETTAWSTPSAPSLGTTASANVDADALVISTEGSGNVVGDPSDDTETDIMYNQVNSYDATSPGRIFSDLKLMFPCAATCGGDIDVESTCDHAVSSDNDELISCIHDACGCHESYQLIEALFYICDAPMKADGKFNGPEYANFLDETVSAVEAHCGKAHSVLSILTPIRDTDDSGNIKAAPCSLPADDPAPAHCFAQANVISTCSYEAPMCGANSSRTGILRVHGSTTEKWSCPAYTCDTCDGDTCSGCTWTRRICTSTHEAYSMPCAYEGTRKGECIECEYGWLMNSETRECDSCDQYFKMDSSGACVEDTEALKKDFNMTDEDLKQAEEMFKASIDTSDPELGAKLRVAALGAFWDDWASELDSLKNKIDDGLDTINDFKNDLIEDIHGIGNAIASLAGDLADLGSKLADLVYDEVSAVVPNANALMNGLSQAAGCNNDDSASLGADRKTVKSRRHHDVRKRVLEAVYGVEIASHYAAPSESAPLGGSCSHNLCAGALCYQLDVKDILKKHPDYSDGVFSLTKTSSVPDEPRFERFQPDYVKAFVDGNIKACAGVTHFGLDMSVLNDVALEFVKVVEPIVDDAVKAITGWADGITDFVNEIGESLTDIFSSVKSTVANINVPGFGRKLLSGDTQEFEQLTKHERALVLGHIVEEYIQRVNLMQKKALSAIAEIHNLVSNDPHMHNMKPMADPKSRARRDIAHLGGFKLDFSVIEDGIISVLRGALNTISTGVSFDVDFEQTLEFDAKGALFQEGDLLDGQANQELFKITPIGPTGFVLVVGGVAKVQLPYFLLAEGSGKLGYKIKGKNVGYTVSISNGVATVAPKSSASLDITPTIDGTISSSLKVGVVAALKEFHIKLCWGGIICIGPKVTIKQGIQFGADSVLSDGVGASTDSSCYNGRTGLSPVFGEFLTSYPTTSNQCSASANVVGAGLYVEYPKPFVTTDIITEVRGDTECVQPLSLLDMTSRAQYRSSHSTSCAASTDPVEDCGAAVDACPTDCPIYA